MSTKQFILSARNPVAAAGYALMTYVATSSVFAAGNTAVTPSAEGGNVVRNFLNNITGILNIASVVVVTIAIIFAGYQIAFNNKRISEVAPVLLGGVLIGGAAQIATMLIGGSSIAAV